MFLLQVWIPHSYLTMSSRRESDFARLERLLREVDKRADLERQRADEEQRNWKEADERAELERQRTEDEQRNREEADEKAKLERQRTEEAESRAHNEEIKTRRTTFKEYIRTCHTLLLKLLRV
jgi:hypothetical protein